MEDYIRPNVFVALKLPSGFHKVAQLKPNQVLSLGKYGSFNTNDLLGRPFYHTYEILEAPSSKGRTCLRAVPASELVEQEILPEAEADGEQPDQANGEGSSARYEVVDDQGKVVMRTNRDILDDVGAQKLTRAEIEELKKDQTATGRDIITKIMESHSEIDKKSAFSLAKYTTRKASKFMRRFTPFPMNVVMLARWCLYEKEASKIMEIREEMLALTMSWSNIHYTYVPPNALPGTSRGRWLVIDETGGLIVAAAAERLGVLYQVENMAQDASQEEPKVEEESNEKHQSEQSGDVPRHQANNLSIITQETHMSATDNTITLVHANAQPNISLLNYFGYDSTDSDASHPLHKHLKTLTWLQLLNPEDDPLYIEPEFVSAENLAKCKSSKRGTYYRKRRRWERTRAVVDETRAGGFDGLIVCSSMKPISPVRHLVPLLSGGAPVVVYSPSIEPLAELADFLSSPRKSAYLNMSDEERKAALDKGEEGDFPINPSLLINPSVYTARAKPWQVLPGRTHPIMTGLGGAQGYIFTATRVLPFEGGRIEAHGAYKRRKVKKDPDTAQAVKPEASASPNSVDGLEETPLVDD